MGGIKPVAQLPAVVPSVVPHPAQPAALGAVRGGGDKTGSSTVGGGPVCGTSPSPASSVRSSTGGGDKTGSSTAGGGPVWYLTQPSQQR